MITSQSAKLLSDVSVDHEVRTYQASLKACIDCITPHHLQNEAQHQQKQNDKESLQNETINHFQTMIGPYFYLKQTSQIEYAKYHSHDKEFEIGGTYLLDEEVRLSRLQLHEK